MYFPTYNEVPRSREMTTVFGGYNHQLSCVDGEFFDMQNMTSEYYPMLSPRKHRGICKQFVKPAGMIDKDGLAWIDDGVLYVNGEATTGGVSTEEDMQPKTLVKMGSSIVVFPDKKAYDTEKKKWTMLCPTVIYGSHTLSVTMASETGEAITWKDESYYESVKPDNGAYALFDLNGKKILKQWSEATAMWNAVNSSYIQFTLPFDEYFKVGDTIKITIDNSNEEFNSLLYLFETKEEDNKYSLETSVVNRLQYENATEGSYWGFVIPGILKESVQLSFSTGGMVIEKQTPDMAFVVECNNRLWGCSKDGHEIYCCALGDFTSWKAYNGIATDAYAATIGSDGVFTGAINYQGNPIFFKEHSMVKVYVSSTGAHQIKELQCRGVQKGSDKSLSIVNDILYYKSSDGICAYDGSVPVIVSNSHGEVRYSDAVAGTIGNRYYVSMKDGSGRNHLFVYDTKTGLWTKEDNTDVMQFCRSGDELYYIDKADNKLKSIRGTFPYEDGVAEGMFDWYAETGNIGFSLPDRKYIAKLLVRLSMEIGTNVGIYIQYDSSGAWEHLCNLNGMGTKTFTVPLIPRRCDHFKYMIAGRGDCKIFSVTKTIEEGSDA